MIRVRRILLNVGTAVSLLVCVAAVGVWVRSHWVEDRVVWRRAEGTWYGWTVKGRLVLGADLESWSAGHPESWGWRYERERPEAGTDRVIATDMLALSVGPRDRFERWERWGVGWWRFVAAVGGTSMTRLIVPLWMVGAVGAVWPVGRLALALRRRRARRAGAVCGTCGYDLRATPERCPECGTSAAVGRPTGGGGG